MVSEPSPSTVTLPPVVLTAILIIRPLLSAAVGSVIVTLPAVGSTLIRL